MIRWQQGWVKFSAPSATSAQAETCSLCLQSHDLCEKNYAQVEKELLSIVDACEQFHQYIVAADTQSTSVDMTACEMHEREQFIDVQIYSVLKTMPFSDGRMNNQRQETAKDSDLAILQSTIITGWSQEE